MTSVDRAICAAIDGLEDRRVAFEPGLSDPEISRVEGTYRFRFPPDLRRFLQTAMPVSGGFPNWRSESENDLRYRYLDPPLQGVLFDIEHNDFWPDDWGPRPSTLEHAQNEAKRHFTEAPILISVRSHHYMPATPSVTGNPVFLIRQTDVTYAASDLLSYLADPFVPRRPASDLPEALDIPFWSDLARRNKIMVPNLAGKHIGHDDEYQRLRQAAEQAGYSAEVVPLRDGKGVSLDREKPHDDRRHGFFWVTKRDFGWFLWVKCPRLYYAPHEDRVAELCLTLLARLPVEELNRGRLPFWNFKLDDEIRRAFGLVAIQHHTDTDDEREANLRSLEQIGWRAMSRGQEDEVWARYENQLGYPAGSEFRTPQPSITWDVSPAFWWKGEQFDRLEADLTLKVLHALQRLTGPGTELLALDWNHPCYFFDPHGGVADTSPSSWAVPVLPNGDHYLFLDQAFQFGLIGNCVDRTICVFGLPLIDALLENPPELFRRPTWTFEERQKKERQWANRGWKRLSVEEKDEIWEQFDQRFAFYENWGRSDGPVIREPTPSLTWDISSAFLMDGRVEAEREADLTERVLAALNKVTRPGERLHALDALHWYEQYSFDPHGLNSAGRDFWALPVLPDDTFTIILGPDFRFGVFGNPHEKTICIFGQELLDALGSEPPSAFGRLVRENGLPKLD